MRTVGQKSFCAHLTAQIIVQTVPPFMCQRSGPVHFREVDNLAERFVVRCRIAAASCSESDCESPLIGNILV